MSRILLRLRAKRGRPASAVQAAVVLLVALMLLVPAVSPAATLTGTSNSYLLSRQQTDGTNLLPGFEYLDFVIQDLGGDTVSAHFGGWANYDFDEKTGDHDVQYGYVSYKSKTDNSTVNVGRVMVFEGVAAERVDGLYARTDLMGGFGISAFGGSPVETNGGADITGNSVIYGGRLSYELPGGLYRIALSALREEKDGDAVRKEEGFDLWLQPISKVEFTGSSKYNAMASEWSKYDFTNLDWASHNYVLALGPFSGVRLTTTASAINYKNYFIGATTPVFSFDPTVLDQNEKVTILGENVSYDMTAAINLSADYKTYSYEIAGDAKYVGGNLKYTAASGGGAGLSLHKMEGDTDRLKYSEYRFYAFKKIDKTDLAFDVIDVKYDVAINGITNAYSASVAVQYDLTEKLKLGADVEYSKNPDFDKDVRGFLKAIYRFDIGAGAEKGA